jgi:class 3 adenylate cyclase
MPASVFLSAKAQLRVPTAALWSFLADTDRLNRQINLPAVRFVPVPDTHKKGHYTAQARSFGMRVSYEEFPFDWVEGRYYQVLRRFPRGPLQEVTSGIRLKPVADGTELEVFAKISPRNVLGLLLTKTVLKKRATRDILALARAFERHFQDPAVYEPAAQPLPALVNDDQLQVRGEALAACPVVPALVPTLLRHLRTASDLEVVGMRPFELADRWGQDRLDVLQLLLHAARVGLLDLTWAILCPNCRAVRSESLTLGQLQNRVHCDTCQINFAADLAQSVEVRFNVNPAVRLAHHETYCIGGPANTPFALAQLRLEPGEQRQEALPLPAGWLRLRCYQADGPVALQVGATGGDSLYAECKQDELRVEGRPVRAGTVTLDVRNDLPVEALVVVERESWKDSAATAAQVTSLQEFKELFSQEVVTAGEEVGIAHLAILFTDLRGSTRLYEKIGDVKAFAFVQNHFRYLVEAIARHRGGVVKKMGDAVMATFANGQDAWLAAVAMQAGWAAFRRQYLDAEEISLKVGIHQGPAIMINNDGRMDYFGTTVNVAARAQEYSQGGDIIISQSVHDDLKVSACLAATDYQCELFKVALKNLTDEQTLYRLCPPEPSG